jgi:hypothetical protein
MFSVFSRRFFTKLLVYGIGGAEGCLKSPDFAYSPAMFPHSSFETFGIQDPPVCLPRRPPHPASELKLLASAIPTAFSFFHFPSYPEVSPIYFPSPKATNAPRPIIPMPEATRWFLRKRGLARRKRPIGMANITTMRSAAVFRPTDTVPSVSKALEQQQRRARALREMSPKKTTSLPEFHRPVCVLIRNKCLDQV